MDQQKLWKKKAYDIEEDDVDLEGIGTFVEQDLDSLNCSHLITFQPLNVRTSWLMQILCNIAGVRISLHYRK